MHIATQLKEKSRQFADKPAIIFKDETISFEQLKDIAFRLAGVLQARGVSKGMKVAVFLPNCPEYIYAYLAAFSLGAVVVPLDYMLTEEEIKNFIRHSESTLLLTKEKKGVSLAAVQQACPTLKQIIVLGERDPEDAIVDTESWDELVRTGGQFSEPAVADNDPSSIFYTSGSTGHPKGVLLNYGHLDNPVRCIKQFIQPTDADSYLCAGVPFSHIGGLDYMLFMLAFGSTLILMDRFQPLEALRNLEKYKVTIFCIVPSMFIAILSLKEANKFDLSSLKYPVVFGAPSSPVLLKRFHELCPQAVLLNGWGMTETAAPNTLSPKNIDKVNSIGPFGAGMEAKVVDESGREVASGERGELWVKGEGVMVEYYKEPELTRAVFTPEGWFRTGDVAIKDKEGLFYIVGRIKDMIKVGGEITFASEIEGVLSRHPKVLETAVIGIPDKLRGEVPKAFIVPKEGESLVIDEIKEFAKKHLAHFKIPHVIEIVDVLPKNRTGKIDKSALEKAGTLSP